MRNNILTLLVGFVVMLGSVMLFKLGLDKMTDASASPGDAYAKLEVDFNRRAILYRVQSGDTLWGLAERFYGSGRRWTEIAKANGIQADAGLQAGTIIRIPLGKDDAEPAPQPQPASYDEMPEPPEAPRFAIDDNALSVTLARLDADKYPAGVLCVARVSESQRVRLNLFDALSGGEGEPVAIYEAPESDGLRELVADSDRQELHSIWQTPASACTTRVFRLIDGKLQLVRETPDDPLALLRLRNSENR